MKNSQFRSLGKRLLTEARREYIKPLWIAKEDEEADMKTWLNGKGTVLANMVKDFMGQNGHLEP